MARLTAKMPICKARCHGTMPPTPSGIDGRCPEQTGVVSVAGRQSGPFIVRVDRASIDRAAARATNNAAVNAAGGGGQLESFSRLFRPLRLNASRERRLGSFYSSTCILSAIVALTIARNFGLVPDGSPPVAQTETASPPDERYTGIGGCRPKQFSAEDPSSSRRRYDVVVKDDAGGCRDSIRVPD